MTTNKLHSSIRCLATVILCMGLADAVFAEDGIVVDPDGKSVGGVDNGIRFGPVHPLPATSSLAQHVNCLKLAQPVNPIAANATTLLRPQVVGISSNQSCEANEYGLDFYTAGLTRLSIDRLGRIGLGTISPTSNMDLQGQGDVQFSIGSNDLNGKTWALQSSGFQDPGKKVAGTFQIIDKSNGKSRFWIDPDGTANVAVLRINGGADLAERFQGIAGLRAGSAVVINDKSPGTLTLSSQPYDRHVAGIISGAKGVDPGVSLEASASHGEQNVALSGRVYALADATQHSIETGDLLTTSALPGRVMKARNLKRAQGAIIGKAMSPLKVGTGYVLVLVSLQ
jgi:hypothetical protein